MGGGKEGLDTKDVINPRLHTDCVVFNVLTDTFGVFLFLINHSQTHVDIIYLLYVFYSILLSCLSTTCSPFLSLNPVYPPAFY